MIRQSIPVAELYASFADWVTDAKACATLPAPPPPCPNLDWSSPAMLLNERLLGVLPDEMTQRKSNHCLQTTIR